MKNKYIGLLILILFAQAAPNIAQVIVDSKLERAEILIGEPVGLTTSVSVGAKQKIQFPEYEKSDTIISGLEVLECGNIDTTYLNGGRRMTLSRRYVLTSFDSALYRIPSMEIEVDGKIHTSRAKLGLKVHTVPVDTTNVNNFAGAYPVMPSHFTWTWSLFWLCFPLWIILPLLLLLAIRLSRRKPAVRKIIIPPPTPPYKKASDAMEGIRSRIGASDETLCKQFFTDLTFTLKTYLAERFNFNASEMTTSEIEDEATGFLDANSLLHLKKVLRTADFVKFAKFKATPMEQQMCYDETLRLLKETYDEQIERPQPVIKIVEYSDKYQHRLRIVLWCVAALLIVICCIWSSICAYKIFQIYF